MKKSLLMLSASLMAFGLFSCANKNTNPYDDGPEYGVAIQGNIKYEYSNSVTDTGLYSQNSYEIVKNETKGLVVIHHAATSGSITPRIDSLYKENGILDVHIDSKVKGGGAGTCDMKYWDITIEYELSYVEDIVSVNVRVN